MAREKPACALCESLLGYIVLFALKGIVDSPQPYNIFILTGDEPMRRALEGDRIHLCLVGGHLQGLEAAYLGREAGYEITVIDIDPNAPAFNLAHNKHVFDIQADSSRFRELLPDVDAVLPTTERPSTLDFLANECAEKNITFLHDAEAYRISSSKILSKDFLASHRVPIPKKWPSCSLPVVVKPSVASGSHGVHVVADAATLTQTLLLVEKSYGDAVVEAFHEGPSLSLEVITRSGIGREYMVTELDFDSMWDCKRVYAPSKSSPGINNLFTKTALEIARCLELSGLMDVEVIVNTTEQTFVVLEIDCRFPSQTPIAVYHASGTNLLKEFVAMHAMSLPVPHLKKPPGCALLEHVSVERKRMKFIGETSLLPWPNVRVWPDGSFYGASTALTDYHKDAETFKATLIFSGSTWFDVLEKRHEWIKRIGSACSLEAPTSTIPRFQ